MYLLDISLLCASLTVRSLPAGGHRRAFAGISAGLPSLDGPICAGIGQMESNLQAPLRSRAAARRRLRLSVKVTAAAVTVFALFASGALLLLDLRHGFLTSRPHRLISALPLLGIARWSREGS